MFLDFLSAIKIIIMLGIIVFISLYSTFSKTSSCANFSLFAKLMANVMNESLYSNRIQALNKSSTYLDYYKDLQVLDSNQEFK